MEVEGAETQVKLKDGGLAYIRLAKLDDAEALVEMFMKLSPNSIYNRFFVFKDRIDREEATKMAFCCNTDEITLVGLVKESDTIRVIADARVYIQGDKGEIGIVVQDDWQNKGLGTALMQRLVEEGRRRGLKRLFLYCMPDNTIMIHVAEKCGFKCKPSSLGVTKLDLPLEGS